VAVASVPSRVELGDLAPTTVLYLPAVSRDAGAVSDRLASMGLSVTVSADLTEALRRLAERRFTLCLVDLGNDRAAVPCIRAVRAQHPHVPVTGLVDSTRPLVAADAIQAGVLDLLPWPFADQDVAAVLASAADWMGVEPVEHEHRPALGADGLFAHSSAMRQVMELVRSAALGRGGVLVCGEPGTGRERVARAIHAHGRPDAPFLQVDCASPSISELEERLFGFASSPGSNGTRPHGAERIGRASLLFQARGGTLFLTNLAEAPSRIQAKLARLLRDREASLVEKRGNVELDVQPIATFEPTLDALVADGHVRRDLYERLAQIRIEVPALRRRREDIPLLAVHLLRELGDQAGIPPKRVSRSALALLAALPWPGNERELRSLLATLAQSVSRPVIQLDDLLEHVRLDGISPRIDADGSLRDAKARFERDWISAVLVKHHGRVGDAARALGIQRTNLYRKVRQLNVARGLLSARKP
jgi:DNA-binding NtrC family response regulator